MVGVIADLALFFAGHVLWPQGPAGALDGTALLIGLAAAAALWRLGLGVVPVLLGAGAVGVALQWLGPAMAGISSAP